VIRERAAQRSKKTARRVRARAIAASRNAARSWREKAGMHATAPGRTFVALAHGRDTKLSAVTTAQLDVIK